MDENEKKIITLPRLTEFKTEMDKTIPKIKELKQAEYDTLNEKERKNGIIYFIPDGQLNNDIISALIPNTPEAHNNFYRGKVLTDYYTLNEIYAMIANRDYHDIFVGDKIKVN